MPVKKRNPDRIPTVVLPEAEFKAPITNRTGASHPNEARRKRNDTTVRAREYRLNAILSTMPTESPHWLLVAFRSAGFLESHSLNVNIDLSNPEFGHALNRTFDTLLNLIGYLRDPGAIFYAKVQVKYNVPIP